MSTSKLSIRRNREQLLKPWTVYSGAGNAQNTLGRFVTWRGALDYVLRRRELQKAAGRENYWFSAQARDAGWRKLGDYGKESL